MGTIRAVTEEEEVAGRRTGAGHCPGHARAASTWVRQLPGHISCWPVTLSLLVLHTQGLEAEGLLLTELVALATLGRM